MHYNFAFLSFVVHPIWDIQHSDSSDAWHNDGYALSGSASKQLVSLLGRPILAQISSNFIVDISSFRALSSGTTCELMGSNPAGL
jgi:hypothetical protein